MDRRKFLKGALGVLGVGAAAAVAPKAALDLIPQEPTKYPPGNSYIFSDAGPELMVLPKKEVVSPEWFGAAANERVIAGLTPLEPPKLWADGIHDDTDAIQWRLDRWSKVDLGTGTYLVSSPLVIRQDNSLFIGGSITSSAKDSYMIFDGAEGAVVNNVFFTCPQGQPGPKCSIRLTDKQSDTTPYNNASAAYVNLGERFQVLFLKFGPR